jgi:hypothetical protein
MNNRLSVGRVAGLVIEDFSFFEPAQSISRYLINFIKRIDPEISDLNAYQFVSRNLQEFIETLLRNQETRHDRGVFCPYEVIPEQKLIVGYSSAQPGDDEYLLKVRQIAPFHLAQLHQIRTLSPDKFELFCSKILELMGANQQRKTKRSNDGGVDFIAGISPAEVGIQRTLFKDFR